jgi:pimeloyl-ACP methyl ester carboxylesterase
MPPDGTSPHPTTTGTGGRSLARSAAPVWRSAAATVVVALGLAVVGRWFSETSAVWVVWLLTGVAAGLVAGTVWRAWTVVLGALAFGWLAQYVATPIEAKVEYWVGLMAAGVTVVAGGFGLGTVLAGPLGIEDRHASRPLPVAGLIGLAVIGFVAWTGISADVAAHELMYPADPWPDCDTPAYRFGWAYEAINYDLADDARLQAENPTMTDCAGQGSEAGGAVVTADGIRIAAWYIPAGDDIGPHGPTLVIAPGWKSNKSEILKYAPPFHESFNLVLLDLRNGGRSQKAATTFGVDERLDVRAVVDWLVREKAPDWIGAVGNSMGAATVLAEAVGDPRIEALILDSMHGTLIASLANGIEDEQALPGSPTAWAAIALASWRVADDMTAVDPVRTIARLGDRPVLLIHGTADVLDRPEESAERNLAAARDAGVPARLVYCEGGKHGQLIDWCSSQWVTWATAFLEPLVSP